MIAMAKAGAVAFSDDGRPMMSAEMMRRALEYAKPIGRPIVCHEEDLTLRGKRSYERGAGRDPARHQRDPGRRPRTIMVHRDCDLAS
jgi:dihydroorotase